MKVPPFVSHQFSLMTFATFFWLSVAFWSSLANSCLIRMNHKTVKTISVVADLF